MSNKIVKQKPARQNPAPPTGNDKVAIVQTSATSFAGPVPPPEILRGYESIVSGSADRIIRMAELDMAHQHQIENRALSLASTEVRIGQVFGLIVSLAAFAAAVYCSISGDHTTASIIGGTTVIALTTVFVTGHQKPENK